MSELKTGDSMTGWNHLRLQANSRPTKLSKGSASLLERQGYLESHSGSPICRRVDSESDLVSLCFSVS